MRAIFDRMEFVCCGLIKTDLRILNCPLTLLWRNKRAVKQHTGHKRPRICNCDVTVAPDAVESDGNDSDFTQGH